MAASQAQVRTMASNFSERDEVPAVDLQEIEFASRGCCSFWNFSCFRSQNWERISTSDREQQQQQQQEINISDNSWWSKGISTLKKVKVWSEIVAGPKWKTFIRRFNRSSGRSKTGKFHYDPFSYALNFDDGEGQNGQFDDDRLFRDFSSRYAAIAAQNAQLKDAPLST